MATKPRQERELSHAVLTCTFDDSSLLVIEKGMFSSHLKQVMVDWDRMQLRSADAITVCSLRAGVQDSSKISLRQVGDVLTVIICNIDGSIQILKAKTRT